jgi:hypothetical protein
MQDPDNIVDRCFNVNNIPLNIFLAIRSGCHYYAPEFDDYSKNSKEVILNGKSFSAQQP